MRERTSCGTCGEPINPAEDLYLDQDGQATSGHPILHRHDPADDDGHTDTVLLAAYHAALIERGRDPHTREDADLCRDGLRGRWPVGFFRAYLEVVEPCPGERARIIPEWRMTT